MTAPLRVLCLDIEGGHGGSSRSLYYLLKHMDRSRIAPAVWCRRDGPVVERYRQLAIPVEVVPDLPKASALPKASRNLVQLAGHAAEFIRGQPTLKRLAKNAALHDVVHFNHEGFAMLASWLKRRTATPITMHMRTNVRPSVFARQQMRLISRAASEVVFITANEEHTFRSLGGSAPGRIIFNVVEPDADASAHPGIQSDGRLVIASLSNAAWVRGTDRLVDVAQELKQLGCGNVCFALAGDMRLAGSWPGELEQTAARGGTLQEAVAARGLGSFFTFLGHVSDPERVLAAADLLIKPTRDDNPWGRDILEAMAAGKPVLSVGRDTTFVETGVTGILQRDFDARELADGIAALERDRTRLAAMGSAARARVAALCDGPSRARDLADVWRSAAGAPG